MVEQKQTRLKFFKVDLVANYANVRVIKKRRFIGPNKTALGAYFEAYRLRFFHFSPLYLQKIKWSADEYKNIPCIETPCSLAAGRLQSMFRL